MIDLEQNVSSSADWLLVVHRVTSTSVEVWVGTLATEMAKPNLATVELVDATGNTHASQINIWERPFDEMDQRFYAVCTFESLTPNTHYDITFWRFQESKHGFNEGWQILKDGQCRTLPTTLPETGQGAFTIGLGSCFYNHRDGGSAAQAYKNLYDHGDPADQPDITFLTGDQVYLDIGFDSLSLIPAEIRQRIARDYAQHWQKLGSIHSRGGTWMLPDDHEYWNDYPFYHSIIPTLHALQDDTVRQVWTLASKNGVENIQRCPTVEDFTIGNELAICLADFRSFRHADGFAPDDMLQAVCNWAEGLTTPGVLALPQPLIVKKNRTERNLRSFPDQYQQLLKSLAHSGHDIVLLSGDVHFGRVASVPLGNNGAQLIEVVSSPLSNLTLLNGIAVSTPKRTPTHFPDRTTAKANGWPEEGQEVNYACEVQVEEGCLFSTYPKDRTKEHFMTTSFSQSANGVELTVKAWSVREPQGPKRLPSNAFKNQSTFTHTLT